MTSKRPALPFLLRFADPVPREDGLPYRYRHDLQVGEILVNGAWRVTSDADAEPSVQRRTRTTLLARETTDD
jgi:hypothetical protein